ncbi:MAG: alpha-hydroxy acid oxidase [Actinomycetes bacterium]
MPEPDPSGPGSPVFPPTAADLERAAERAMGRAAWDYIAHGAGDEVTMRANVDAWSRWALRPRVLRDMTRVETTTTVLGIPVSAPVLVAPTAMHRFVCAEGEPATARAAARAGVVYVTSMAATTSIEDIAAAAPGAPRFAQMYLLRDRGRTRALAERAGAAGYRAVVASVDGAAVPRRSRLAGGALVPPADFRFPNLAAPDDDSSDLMGMVSDFDPAVTFDDLARFGEWSGLPVVVKGVMRPDDAVRCVEAGAAAVAVSNHGGRTLDGVAATASVLPEVAAAVAGRAEVYVDGGVRSGVDVLRALCLGADAVMIGRPVLWGLAVDGEIGALALLDRFREELGRAMALCGSATVATCDRDLLGEP